MEQNASSNTFEIPNRTPEQFQKYVDEITKAVEWAYEEKGAPNFVTNEGAADVIVTSFLLEPFEWWIKRFRESVNEAALSYEEPNTFWRHVALGVSTPEVKKRYLEIRPALEEERITSALRDGLIEILDISTNPPRPCAPDRKSPEQNPDLKNLSTYGLIKHYVEVRRTSVFDYISEQSGSTTFANIHTFIQHHGNFKLSSRGKVIYDGGFHWIKRELNTSIPTVWRAFHWMAQRKLVSKIAPSDYRNKKRSRWYVCTSMAQNLKLWSDSYRAQGG